MMVSRIPFLAFVVYGTLVAVVDGFRKQYYVGIRSSGGGNPWSSTPPTHGRRRCGWTTTRLDQLSSATIVLTTRGGSSVEEGDSDPLNKKEEEEEEEALEAGDETAEEDSTTIVEEEYDVDEEEEGKEEAVDTEEEEATEAQEESMDPEEPVAVNASLEEDSSANIDRMDYADAYDEEVDNEDADATVQSVLNSDGNKIPLAQSITPAMREVLVKQLKYRRGEVQRMRPDIAAIVIAKELQRPQEGIPPHWTVGREKGSKGLKKSAIAKILLSVSACVMGGFLVSERMSGKSDYVWEAPASISTSAVEDDYEIPLPEEPIVEATPSSETMTEQSPVFEQQPHHEHSVRPGEHPPLEPIDDTALDKFLTKIEKGLATMFGR